jgi:alginate O-acetyltransferase complex protein AlgI
MSFTELNYYIFLFVVYLLYRGLANRGSFRQILLVSASLFFYSLGSGWHLCLLIFSGLSDHFIALKIQKQHELEKGAKGWMWFSVINNLCLLAVFKYLGPISSSFSVFLDWLDLVSIPTINLLLPIGISFYTFQTLSYTLDVSFKRIQARKNPLDTLTYVCFFPQLVAGPILRANDFLPQLKKRFTFDSVRFKQGVFFILLGLFKKIVIADSIGIFLVDPIYNPESQPGAISIIFGTFAYAFQIYNDFSGYSDIAIGSALILGFVVPNNFDRPFTCNNPTDFWNRWHISLSHWVRDYLFYPLMMKGGILKGRVLANLFITILVIGIWHGPNLTFLLFGIFHATLSVLHHVFRNGLDKIRRALKFLWMPLSWLIYWHFLNIGILFFRAEDLEHIKQLFGQLSHLGSFPFQDKPLILWVAIGFSLATHLPRANDWDRYAKSFAKSPLLIQISTIWILFCFYYWAVHLHQGRSAFIYFRF